MFEEKWLYGFLLIGCIHKVDFIIKSFPSVCISALLDQMTRILEGFYTMHVPLVSICNVLAFLFQQGSLRRGGCQFLMVNIWESCCFSRPLLNYGFIC